MSGILSCQDFRQKKISDVGEAFRKESVVVPSCRLIEFVFLWHLRV